MKKFLFLLLTFISISGFSQSLNDYKYAIVPSKFSFLKQNDQYRMNTLTKMFMEKYGFETYFDNDILPAEVANQNCNKVYVEVLKSGNMFTTKLTVVLKDCKNNILFTSSEGKSKEKEFQTAYNQALREAFGSFDVLRHKYNGTITNTETIIVKTTNDGATIKQEVIPVNSNIPPLGNSILFAQPIENGFQLVDNTPKVLMKVFKTSSKDLFLTESNRGTGILFLKNEKWFFEYYVGGKLISEILEIKF